ncbi:FAD-binding oxidoreductase [Clostridiaceae bacterium M8S5]|nr:FAD-binding oxidoreductase [Clostridiaceae bacterium M8S5]
MLITGGVVCKDNPIYPEASSDFNLAFKKFPRIIVFCFSEEDVKNALKYAVSNDTKFRVRTGRHDYEANSNVNKGMVIDISNINYTIVDEINKTAKLGGGITSGKMYFDLVDKGYTIPSGTCPDVGFGALTSNGGVGFASRLLGLACDNLLEAELINYKGDKIVANKDRNKNLFWAIQGGLASNFGVLVSLTYKITPVCKVSTYVITWNNKYFVDVVAAWQTITPDADVRLTNTINYEKKPSGEIILSSRGQFFGKPEKLEQIIKPLIDAAPIESIDIEYIPYKKAIEKWADDCSGPRKFKATGSFIFEPLSKRMLNLLNEKLINAPKNSAQFYEFMALNGNVSNVKPNETAYVHRDALYLLEIESIWTLELDRKDNIDWTNNVKSSLDTAGVGTYRGFTDFHLVDWQKQYYGDNYLKLREVKSKYDPQNIFNFPQSIKPL